MDLKHLTDAPTEAERRAVDAALEALGLEFVIRPHVNTLTGVNSAPEGSALTFRETRARRTYLLPALLALQSRVGFVTRGGLGYVCERLGVPPAEAFGVASFYALLALDTRPEAFAHICDDIACQEAGAEKLCADMERHFGSSTQSPHRADGAPAADAYHIGKSAAMAPLDRPMSTFTPRAGWAKSPCLGLCDQAPAALVTIAGATPVEQSFGHATLESVQAALRGTIVARTPVTLGCQGPRRLLARAGKVDPTSLDAYRASQGFDALHRALELGPAAVIAAVNESKLVGRGGAAFPTGRKWDAVSRAAARPRYVVCNADESEPGTFKDRVLLELDPFAVIEAMTIAGFATGAERGYLYLRGEYPLAAERLTNALNLTRKAAWLGNDIGGSVAGRASFAFDIELRRGAGAYICGEETALFASIEGYRGEPRSKPPFPVESGLYGKPTAINNVETLVAVLDIVRDGAAAYASVGTAGSPGTKLFCVSGRVANPGVYEVPFGTTLGAVIDLAGGVLDARTLQGVLLGGAAGGFVAPAQLDVPLSFEGARAAGLTLGSGVVMVLDDTVSILPMLRRIAEFFRDESCGQCVPCRVGTVRQEELLARLARNAPLRGLDEERALLGELGQAMRDASICGLGQTASSAIESGLKVFHILDGGVS